MSAVADTCSWRVHFRYLLVKKGMSAVADLTINGVVGINSIMSAVADVNCQT